MTSPAVQIVSTCKPAISARAANQAFHTIRKLRVGFIATPWKQTKLRLPRASGRDRSGPLSSNVHLLQRMPPPRKDSVEHGGLRDLNRATLFAAWGGDESREPLAQRKKPLVVVTRKLPDSVETRMRELFDTQLNLDDKPMTTAQLADTVRSADVLVPTVTDRIDASVLSKAGDKLKLIANYGNGVDH